MGTTALCVALLTGCGSPVDNLIEAVNDGNITQAQQIYADKISGKEGKKDQLVKKAKVALDSLIEQYNSGVINEEEADAQFSVYKEMIGSSSVYSNAEKKLNELKSSKFLFSSAKEYHDKGNNITAYDLCKMVSESDTNYEAAQNLMKQIYFDKASGKNFNRRSWNTLVGTLDTAPVLREGDLLVVSSLDRMGRNYTEIQEQWQYITHELKADIRVIDMPMLDTSKNTDNLDRRFIADLVLQILSYTAQKERENIHKRQEMGIAAAQSKGVKFGRPKAQYPAEWEETYKAWKNGEITATAAMEKMGTKRTTFYKLVKRYEQKEN